MKRPNGMHRIFEAAVAWHAATYLAGERDSQADRHLRRAVCRYLKTRAERDRRHATRRRK